VFMRHRTADMLGNEMQQPHSPCHSSVWSFGSSGVTTPIMSGPCRVWWQTWNLNTQTSPMMRVVILKRRAHKNNRFIGERCFIVTHARRVLHVQRESGAMHKTYAFVSCFCARHESGGDGRHDRSKRSNASFAAGL